MIGAEFWNRIPLYRAMGAAYYGDLRPANELTLSDFGIVLADPWRYAKRINKGCAFKSAKERRSEMKQETLYVEGAGIDAKGHHISFSAIPGRVDVRGRPIFRLNTLRGTDIICPWCGEQQDIHATIDDGDELECKDCYMHFKVEVETIYETYKIDENKGAAPEAAKEEE